ncbi:MAG: hypothetical protein IT252_08200 [Chitinophagaceae bacterium]|jgi:serralysin|nr:hypothetical protein [Chitinophagaceae bacterium]
MKSLKVLKAAGMALAIMSMYSSAQAQICATKEAEARLAKVAFIDTTKTRGLADNYFLWDVGETIYVKFMNGSPRLQEMVKQYAREWEQFANIKFEFVQSGRANVRVMFSQKKSNYSMLGTYCNSVPQNEHTMHFDSVGLTASNSWGRTVVHEFGHAIGMMHEHFSPMSGIQWNMDTLYADYAKVGWGKDDVDNQVVYVAKQTYTNGTAYDPKSIMHYPVNPRHTKNGYSVGWNMIMSDGDKRMAAILYPRDGVRTNEVPRVNVSEYTTTTIKHDPVNQGLRIYPSFVVSTAGVKGTVYFIAIVFDKDGKALPATDKSYNVSGAVATYRNFVLEPGQVLSANKNAPDDFELFIPYSQIPKGANTSEIKVVFKTWVSGKDEFKPIYSSNPIAFSMNR